MALKDQGLSELQHLLTAGRLDQGMLAREEPVWMGTRGSVVDLAVLG